VCIFCFANKVFLHLKKCLAVWISAWFASYFLTHGQFGWNCESRLWEVLWALEKNNSACIHISSIALLLAPILPSICKGEKLNLTLRVTFYCFLASSHSRTVNYYSPYKRPMWVNSCYDMSKPSLGSTNFLNVLLAHDNFITTIKNMHSCYAPWTTMIPLLLPYPMKPSTCKLGLTFGVENSMEAKIREV
jgi:hypothetical protein